MMIGKRRSAGPHSFQRGRYVVRRLLGHGSTGAVYEATDQELDGESIALKLLHSQLLDSPGTLDQFRNQVLLTRQLSHPNIVQVYDFDRDEHGNHFITMELIDGLSLSSLLQERAGRPLPLPEVFAILSEITKGLAYAHSLGILHRDLNPSNLLVSYTGQVKLSDFGFAKGLEAKLGLTLTGELLGSPAYSAPEQFRGEDLDARSDVYSFGVLAFQLATGRLPFESESFFAQAEAHVTQSIPDMNMPGAGPMPFWFRDFVVKCCEKNPRKRYQSAIELWQVLDEQLKNTETVLPETLHLSFIKNARLSRQKAIRPWVLGIALLTFLLAAYVIGKQTNVRRFVGGWTLRTEKLLGFELPFIKNIFLVTVSTLRPEDFLEEISKVDPGRANVSSYLQAGGTIDVTDSSGNGLGHRAISNQEIETLRMLEEAGYDFDRVNARGETPLLRAIRMHLPGMAEFLVSRNVDLDKCDRSSSCPIHLAIENDYRNLLYVMISRGLDLAKPNSKGLSVFHTLALSHDFEKLQFLASPWKKYPWNFDSRDFHGLTPLMYAVQSPDEEVHLRRLIKLLVSNGAKLESRDDLGRTPLIHALMSGNSGAVDVLLSLGANFNVRDGEGKSARNYAEEAGLLGLDSVKAKL